MKMQKALKYQLSITMKNLLQFFFFYTLAMVLVFILTTVFAGSNVQNGEMVSAGDSSAMVFMLVMGIVIYRETLRFMIQQGISRKMTVKATIANGLICAAAISIVNTVINMLFSMIDGPMVFRSLSELIYANAADTAVTKALFGVVFNFFGAAVFYFIGLFITLGYYRLNRKGKVVVSISVPMFLLVLLPVLDKWIWNGAIFKVVIRIFGWIAQSPVNLFVVYGVLAAVTICFILLLNRRVNVNGGAAK